MTLNPRQIERTHVRQQDQRDCGVACLLALVRYYGGINTFEQIRRLCGADLSGTTLMGLKEAATALGFEADGYQADLPSLKEHGAPVVLHVVLDGGLQHYVVWYGLTSTGQHLIGDPASDIEEWTDDKLLSYWRSGVCLVLSPNERFEKQQEQSLQKKKWFWALIHQDVPLLAISAGLGILLAILGMVMAVYSQQLIDKILPSKNATRIGLATLLVLVLLLARVGLSVLRQLLMLRQSKGFGLRMNTAFFDRLLVLPKAFFDTRKVGDFVARLNDTSRIQSTVSYLAGSLLIDLLMVMVSFGLLLYYNWHVGLVCLLAVPLYFWLVYRQRSNLIEAQRQVMVAYSLSESNYISSIQGIADIKNRNKQNYFSQVNQTLYGYYQERIYESGIQQTRLSAWIGVASVLFIAIVLSLTVRAVYLGQLQIGEMTAILTAVSSLIPSVTNIALISVPLNDARIAFERMYEFVQTKAEPISAERPALDFSSLRFEDVSFRFPGKTALLQHISLALQKGEAIALVGENGSGKSMICQLIQRFYDVSSGQIIVNGHYDLATLDVAHWRCLVGVVPQQVHIFNGTVIDNICLSMSEVEIQTALQLLESYGFEPFFKTLPQHVLTIVGEEGINLSGGQRQLIGLARALVARPQLLILDEATASLDRQSERFVIELIKRLKSQLGIIYITHRLHTLHLFIDRIYLLENSGISETGTHQQLLQKTNMYSAYWYEIVGALSVR